MYSFLGDVIPIYTISGFFSAISASILFNSSSEKYPFLAPTIFKLGYVSLNFSNILSTTSCFAPKKYALYPFSHDNFRRSCIKSIPATLSGRGLPRYLEAKITDAPSAFIISDFFTISSNFLSVLHRFNLSALTPIRCNGFLLTINSSTLSIVS